MSGRVPNDCRELGALLGRVADSEVAPDEALQVARHLSDCTSCRIILAREKRLAAILEREMEDPIRVDDSFVDEVMARLPQGPPPRPQRRSGRRRLMLASIGGVLFLLAWLVLNVTVVGGIDATTWSLAPRFTPPESAGFAEGASQIGGLVLMAMDRLNTGQMFNNAGAYAGLLGLLAFTLAASVGLTASAGALWVWLYRGERSGVQPSA